MKVNEYIYVADLGPLGEYGASGGPEDVCKSVLALTQKEAHTRFFESLTDTQQDYCVSIEMIDSREFPEEVPDPLERPLWWHNNQVVKLNSVTDWRS